MLKRDVLLPMVMFYLAAVGHSAGCANVGRAAVAAENPGGGNSLVRIKDARGDRLRSGEEEARSIEDEIRQMDKALTRLRRGSNSWGSDILKRITELEQPYRGRLSKSFLVRLSELDPLEKRYKDRNFALYRFWWLLDEPAWFLPGLDPADRELPFQLLGQAVENFRRALEELVAEAPRHLGRRIEEMAPVAPRGMIPRGAADYLIQIKTLRYEFDTFAPMVSRNYVRDLRKRQLLGDRSEHWARILDEKVKSVNDEFERVFTRLIPPPPEIKPAGPYDIPGGFEIPDV